MRDVISPKHYWNAEPCQGCEAPPQLLTHICMDRCPRGPMPVEASCRWDPGPPWPLFFKKTLLTTSSTHPELGKADKPVQQLPGETGGQTRKCGFGINYLRNVIEWAMSPLGWRYQWAKRGAERSTAQIIPKTRGTAETLSSSFLVLCFNHIHLPLFKL